MTITAPPTVPQGSTKLYEALTHHFGPMDLAANHPLVVAIAEYGQHSREGDESAIKVASQHVYEALTRHQGNRDFGPNDPVVIALAEYKDACRAAGMAS